LPQFSLRSLSLGLCLALSATVAFSMAACGGQPTIGAKAAAQPAASPASSQPADPQPAAPSANTGAPAPAARLFSGSGAAWLYTAPTGSGLNISSITSGMHFKVNAHDGGFDYPIQYADGSLGCTTFTDTRIYGRNDKYCVPNPPGGFKPSTGAWGADDGHVVVIDTAAGVYYDLWKLYLDGSGKPQSTNIGEIASGSMNGNGAPGTTAADLTGAAGDIMPGELDCADCLQHALSMIVPGNLNSPQVGTQAPVAKTDGSVGGAIFREGAKIRLDPNLNVDSLQASTAAKAVMKALQRYGGVITDQTGDSGILMYSDLATTPDTSGLDQIGGHLYLYY